MSETPDVPVAPVPFPHDAGSADAVAQTENDILNAAGDEEDADDVDIPTATFTVWHHHRPTGRREAWSDANSGRLSADDAIAFVRAQLNQS